MVWPHGRMVLHDRSWLPLLQLLILAMNTWIKSWFLSLTLPYVSIDALIFFHNTARVSCFNFPWIWKKNESHVFRNVHQICTKSLIGTFSRIHNVAWSIMYAQSELYKLIIFTKNIVIGAALLSFFQLFQYVVLIAIWNTTWC